MYANDVLRSFGLKSFAIRVILPKVVWHKVQLTFWSIEILFDWDDGNLA